MDTYIFDKLAKTSPTAKRVIHEHPSLGKDSNNSFKIQDTTTVGELEESPNEKGVNEETQPSSMVIKKGLFQDTETYSEPTPPKKDYTETEKKLAKRYFNDMIEEYPELVIKLIKGREKAKQAKIEADRLMKESDEEINNCLNLFDYEPLDNVVDHETN